MTTPKVASSLSVGRLLVKGRLASVSQGGGRFETNQLMPETLRSGRPFGMSLDTVRHGS